MQKTRDQATPSISINITRMTLEALAPLPTTVMRLLPLLDDPDVPLRHMADVMVRDVGISASVLRVANSPVYGLQKRVGTVSDAIRVIGTSQVRLLVIASGVSQAARTGMPIYSLEPGNFLRHSELVANLAMYVAHDLSYSNIGLAYSTGLLHDIGKVVINGLAQQYSSEPTSCESEMKAQECTLMEAERSLYRVDHADIGRQLVELWSLPPELAEAIALHHDIARATGKSLTQCVSIANVVAGLADPKYPASNKVSEMPAVDAVDLEKLQATAERLVKDPSLVNTA
jgi:putative nucleotidyltransferase with HDIG domain